MPPWATPTVRIATSAIRPRVRSATSGCASAMLATASLAPSFSAVSRL